MTVETIRGAVRLVLDGGLVDKHLSVVWHAGEPFVLPVSYYAEAFKAIEQVVQAKVEVSHAFQTNATRIDDTWCDFLKLHNTRIGLSIDGPDFLHDLHRRTRAGGGTHALAVGGARRLRDHGIPFHVIAVISNDSLDHAEAIFRFFEDLGATEVGFNIEEVEGSHRASSLTKELAADRVSKFWRELRELYDASKGRMQIREFRRAVEAILTAEIGGRWQDAAKRNDQVTPFRIVSVDCYGGVSTFSPELLGVADKQHGNFTFGQIGRDDFNAIRKSASFLQVAAEVMQGVEECAKTCEYFSVCGGGAPSNKYFENGALNSTETMYCRASIQLPVQIVLANLEMQVALSDQKRSFARH
jgi:uncharacterized protein